MVVRRNLFTALIQLLILAPLTLLPCVAQDKDTNDAPTPQEFRIGGVSLLVPTPTSELVETGPDLRVLLDVLAPDSNRMLAAFITREDLASLSKGGNNRLSKYCLVEVARRLEFLDLDEASFKTVTDGASSQMGQLMDSAAKTEGEALNRRLAALGADGKIALDKPVQLGAMFSKRNAFGFATMIPVSSEGQTANMIGGTIILRVRNRLVFAYVFTEYKDDKTASWVRKVSEDWADAVLKANEK